MKIISKSISRILTGLAMAAFVFVGGSSFAESVEMTIIHFNDLDRMEESGGQGGVAPPCLTHQIRTGE